MKKIIILPLVFILTLTLTSCFGETDHEAAFNSAVTTIEESVSEEVTTNFRLLRALPGGVSVTWETDNKQYIDVSGQYTVINRSIDAYHRLVILTANLTLDNDDLDEPLTEELTFDVTLPTMITTSISDVLQGNVGESFYIIGTVSNFGAGVTGNMGNTNRWFQISDGSNSIRIRTKNMANNPCPERVWVRDRLNLNDEVLVRGTIEIFQSGTYLGVSTFTEFASNHKIIIL